MDSRLVDVLFGRGLLLEAVLLFSLRVCSSEVKDAAAHKAARYVNNNAVFSKTTN